MGVKGLSMPLHDRGVPGIAAFGAKRAGETCAMVLAALTPDREDATGDGMNKCAGVEAVYEPGRSLCAAFVLHDGLREGSEGSWFDGEGMYVRYPVREPMSRRGVIVTIDGVRYEAYRFPNDRRLGGMRRCTSREAAISLWREVAVASAAVERGLQRTLIRYVPEHRCVARLRRRDGAGDEDVLAGGVALRMARVRTVEPLAKRYVRARQDAKSQGLTIRFPEVLHVDAKRGLLATRWIKGTSVLEAMNGEVTPDLWTRCAAVLEAHQRLVIPGLKAQTNEVMLKDMHQRADDLKAVRPDLDGRIEDLTGKIERVLSGTRCEASVTIHRDWHFDQLRLRRRSIVVLDIDRMSRGEAMIDVANFVVQLRMLGHRPEYGISTNVATGHAQACLSAHGDPDRGPTASRFGAFAAMAALTLGWGMMRHLRPGWWALIEACVHEAEGWATRSGKPLAEVKSP